MALTIQSKYKRFEKGQSCICIFCIAAIPKRPLCNCSIIPHKAHKTNDTLTRSKHTRRKMAFLTDTHIPGSNLFERFAAFRAATVARAVQAREFRRVYNELSGMSDRDLADIGISRGMIRSIAYEAGYGK